MQHIAVGALGDDPAEVSLYSKEMARGDDDGGQPAAASIYFPMATWIAPSRSLLQADCVPAFPLPVHCLSVLQ